MASLFLQAPRGKELESRLLLIEDTPYRPIPFSSLQDG
jgi:hypothetical protein